MRAGRIFLALAVAVGLSGVVAAGEGCLSMTCAEDGTCPPADAALDAFEKDQTSPADVSRDHAVHHEAGADSPHDAGHRDHEEDDARDAEGDRASDASSDRRADGGGDGAADGGVQNEAGRDTAPACNGTATPSQDPCVITETYGVFVAPPANGGSDPSGDGSRKKPYATLTKAISAAAGLRVYACGATYPESVTIDSSTGGVAIYGGLECPPAVDAGVAEAGTIDGGSGAWSYTRALASVAPASTGYALDVESSVIGVHFEDMAFTAMDADPAHAGESSIAVIVNASSNVSFTRVTVTAGSGSMGADGGALPTNLCTAKLDGGVSVLAGSATSTGGGGAQGACTCPVFGTTAGGGGGSAALTAGGSGTTGGAIPAASLVVAGYDGLGGGGATTTPFARCQNGDPGANGSPQAGGTPGSTGSLTSTGWQPTTAGSGMPGGPGEGGGGGGGEDGTGALGGAGGGGGGCGGNGGAGGGGGGASIAIAVVNSSVVLHAMTIQTAAGGQGGTGAQGEQGQAGGTGGFGASQCSGGNGGQGAGGSGGGGGAGGPSVGVALSGTSSVDVDGMAATVPLTSATWFKGGLGGEAGSAGIAGLAATGDAANPGQPGNPGSAGPAGDVRAVESL
jgi:hypothetical protein